MSARRRRTGAARKPLLLWLTVALVAGLVGLSVLVGPENDDGNPDADPADDPVFVSGAVTLAPGLHLLGALPISVAYVVETTDGLVLIDCGMEGDHQLLLRQLDQLQLDVHDLRMILVTHAHGDHYLGAMALRRLTGAKIHAGIEDSRVIREAGPREAVFSTFEMDHVSIHPTDVDVELSGGETIELGDARIQVIATPGHTPGSMCYLMQRNGQTVLFSGDTIMTLTGDLGTYSTYLPPLYGGDARDYLATLHKLQEIPVPDLLLPGHPRRDVGMLSAQVTPQQWSALLDKGIRQMEELIARYDTDGADFLDGNPKELLPGLHYLGDFAGTSMYCFVHESSLILFDAPGGPELSGFLERRLEDIGLELSMLVAVVLTESVTEATAGLTDLVGKTDCQVVAARTDLGSVRDLAPDATLVPAEAVVSEYGWFPLQPVSIAGFAGTRTAFRIEWAGKRVLLSGRVPPQSLARIPELQPELWLPARPVHGQNANLYGSDWQDALTGRRQ